LASEVRSGWRERKNEGETTGSRERAARASERASEKKNPSLKPFQKKNSSGIWVYYIYFVFGSSLFPGSFNKEKDGLSMPPRSAVLEQIKVASKAMPLYALLPSLVENLAERGVTASFSRIDRDVGGIVPYLLLITAYMSFVEWGVYWVHRGLHDWKTGYR
jgi:sterol desaturase/sphingolipid hydroxylase (fatty acid hydroxylase superfamily)